MARTPAQRGAVGNWLLESRLARSYTSQGKARSEIERLTGWRIAQSVYAEWESGRRVPEGPNLERLQAFYGPMPTDQDQYLSNGSVAAAIREQTAVFTRLADALENREKNQRAWEQQLIRALRIEMGEHRAQGEEVLERLGELAGSLGLEGTPNGGGRGTPGGEG